MRSNTYQTILGITPLISASSISGPVIVNVFPELVCPYARTVPLKPSNTLSTIANPASSYTIYCVVFMSNTLSKLNLSLDAVSDVPAHLWVDEGILTVFLSANYGLIFMPPLYNKTTKLQGFLLLSVIQRSEPTNYFHVSSTSFFLSSLGHTPTHLVFKGLVAGSWFYCT